MSKVVAFKPSIAVRPLLFSRDMALGDDIRAFIPEAAYREPVDADEEANPWLLALERPIESRKELRERLTTEVQVTEADRGASRLRRQQLLLRMRRFVHPLGTLRVFYEHIVLMMHEGYVSRQARMNRLKQGRGAATGLACFFVGRSGIGKSTAVEAALSLIPGAIEHVAFNGRPFARFQIPHIKINLASNAKEVCSDLLRAFDYQAGTTYHATLYSSATPVHRLITDICGIICVHGVGVIVFDDVQNLFQGKSNDQAQIIEFITRLINIEKVPLVFLGTEEALPLFRIRLDTARRVTGLPTVAIGPLEQGPEWLAFCRRLWEMRVLRIDGPMPEGFADKLLELSRGISDIAVKLVHFAQHRALAFEEERLDAHLLSEVYEIAMALIRDKVKDLGADPFQNYGDRQRSALDPHVNASVLDALSAVRAKSAEVRAAVREATAPKAVLPHIGTVTVEIPKPAKRKAKLSRKGGEVCRLAEIAVAEGMPVHDRLVSAGLVWQLGVEVAAT